VKKGADPLRFINNGWTTTCFPAGCAPFSPPQTAICHPRGRPEPAKAKCPWAGPLPRRTLRQRIDCECGLRPESGLLVAGPLYCL